MDEIEHGRTVSIYVSIKKSTTLIIESLQSTYPKNHWTFQWNPVPNHLNSNRVPMSSEGSKFFQQWTLELLDSQIQFPISMAKKPGSLPFAPRKPAIFRNLHSSHHQSHLRPMWNHHHDCLGFFPVPWRALRLDLQKNAIHALRNSEVGFSEPCIPLIDFWLLNRGWVWRRTPGRWNP